MMSIWEQRKESRRVNSEWKSRHCCAKAGVSTSQVSKYLRGVRPITTDELDLLCEAIGIGFERLVVEASHRTRGRHGNMGEGAAQGEFGAPVRGESGWWER